MGRAVGTTVFVGNISYDTTEEQLREVFSQVGNVVKFRLMFDSATGRPKGFGFCEYEDQETAMSARRNLNGTQLNGRPLRVDLTDSDKNNPALNAELTLNDANRTKPVTHPALPKQLQNANPSMALMPLAEIHSTMLQLKEALVQNTNDIRQLLVANPRLAHAVLQAQIMLGMIPPPLLPPPNHIAPQKPLPRQPPPPRPAIRPNMPPSMPPNMPRPNMPPRPNPQRPNISPAQRHPPMPLQQPMQNMALGHGGHMSNGPPHMRQNRMHPPPPPMSMSMSMPPPPPPNPHPPAANPQMPVLAPGGGVDEQAAILNRVLTMTQHEINALPIEERNYVLEIKRIMQRGNPPPPPPPPPG